VESSRCMRIQKFPPSHATFIVPNRTPHHIQRKRQIHFCSQYIYRLCGGRSREAMTIKIIFHLFPRPAAWHMFPQRFALSRPRQGISFFSSSCTPWKIFPASFSRGLLLLLRYYAPTSLPFHRTMRVVLLRTDGGGRTKTSRGCTMTAPKKFPRSLWIGEMHC
jgi:hypothetical protein